MTVASLAGLSVLVTRPAHQAQGLIQRLTMAGATVATLPLLAIEAPRDPEAARHHLRAFAGADGWIFTSANAVQGAAKLQPENWPEALFALGQGTARALTALGHRALAPEGATSEQLLLWPELTAVAGRRFLIVTGEGGRGVLADTLRARGAVVEAANTYRRVRVAHAPAAVTAAVTGAAVILLTGGEALTALVEATSPGDRPTLFTRPLVVPSARVVELARRAGFQGQLLVPGAVSDAAYIARLEAWYSPQPPMNPQ